MHKFKILGWKLIPRPLISTNTSGLFAGSVYKVQHWMFSCPCDCFLTAGPGLCRLYFSFCSWFQSGLWLFSRLPHFCLFSLHLCLFVFRCVSSCFILVSVSSCVCSCVPHLFPRLSLSLGYMVSRCWLLPLSFCGFTVLKLFLSWHPSVCAHSMKVNETFKAVYTFAYWLFFIWFCMLSFFSIHLTLFLTARLK